MIYLASPMSHPSQAILDLRLHIATAEAGLLMSGELHIYCPAALSLGLQVVEALPQWEHSKWMRYDEELFKICDALYVVEIVGWEESKGVGIEIEWAKARGMPVTMLRPTAASVTIATHNRLLENYNDQS